MNFQEVKEYSGFVKRNPTEEEIELILAVISTNTLQAKQKTKDRVVPSKMAEELQKIIDGNREELNQTSFILDFSSIDKRIFVHHEIVVMLEDHADIRAILTSLNPNKEEKEEFGKEFNKATATHNHLYVMSHYLSISKDNEVNHLKSFPIDMCLKTYPKES